MTRRKTIDIDAVLDAAEAVIMEVGHHRLTLNLVAAKAGISRGGLAYSFPTKDDLLRAATRREMERFTSEVVGSRENAGEPASGHPAILARLAVVRTEDERMIARAASLSASLLQSEQDSAPLRQQYRADLQALGQTTPEERRARLAFWALEGLFLMRGLGFMKIDKAEWEAAIDDIRDMYRGDL